MCVRTPLSVLLLVPFTVCATLPGSYSVYRELTVPPDLVDAAITAAGDVYLLVRGLPHLIVLRDDGSSEEYDLEDITVPGGLFLDQGWGWFATGELSGTVYRYDRNGVLSDSWQAAGLPADIAVAGLSILYVSRIDGTVRSLRDPDAEVVDLSGAGDGQLTPFGSRFVYSGREESMVLDEFNAPRMLPSAGTWSAAGGRLVLLSDSCVCAWSGTGPVTPDGEILFSLPQAGNYSRIALSGGGGFCLLWSPGEERALVLR